MTDIVPSDLLPQFRVLFPEFAAIPDAQVEEYLGVAIAMFIKCTNVTLWLAAFLLNEDISASVDPSGGGTISGQILRMKVDSKEVQASKVSTDNPSDEQYMINRYGRMYLRLRAACLGFVLSGGIYGNKRGHGYGGWNCY